MLVDKLKALALTFFVVGAFVILCQSASTVSAMCIYNSTDIAIDVDFDCEIFCGNSWHTEPNIDYCRTATSGTVGTNWICCSGDGAKYPAVQIHVDAHGYVVMTRPSSDEIDVCSYRADNSLDSCKSFDPTS